MTARHRQDEAAPAAPCASVVIDGGHFTLRRASVAQDGALPPGLYYCEASATEETSPFEIARVRRQNASTRCWVVFRISDGEDGARARAGITGEIMRLSEPSPTEFGTLRRAIGLYRLARARGRPAKLRIMIGDLGVPPELRASGDWALPPAYRALLARSGIETVDVLLESRCRNMGNRRAREHFKKLIDGQGRWGMDYRTDGYGVVKRDDGATGSYYLVADALVADRLLRAAILLTQDGTRPTCAVTLAASLLPHMRGGVSDYVAIHDEADDPRIRAKIVDGAAVAAYLGPRSTLTCHVVTLEHGRRRALDRVNFASLRTRGRFGKFSGLVEKVSQKMRRLDPRWMMEAPPGGAAPR